MPAPNHRIQFGDYVDGLRISSSYARPLAIKLQKSAPADLDPIERRRLDGVIASADAIVP